MSGLPNRAFIVVIPNVVFVVFLMHHFMLAFVVLNRFLMTSSIVLYVFVSLSLFQFSSLE